MSTRVLGALAAAWLVLLLAGMGFLWRYKTTPGADARVVQAWPQASRLALAAQRPTLLVFVHPCCPCTRATLGELRALLPHYEGRVSAQVVMLRPAAAVPEWDDTEVVDEVRSLPGAALVLDEDGREAARFGVETSGHVLLFGASGALRFSGGIDAARGHLGENGGLDALRTELESELRGEVSTKVARAPVFGCALSEREEQAP